VRAFLSLKDRQAPDRGARARPGSPEFLRLRRARCSRVGPPKADGRLSNTVDSAGPAETRVERRTWRNSFFTETASSCVNSDCRKMFPAVILRSIPRLRTMEDSGRVRRGMFVADWGRAVRPVHRPSEILRSLRADPEKPEASAPGCLDPAKPSRRSPGLPREPEEQHGMHARPGASLILINGRVGRLPAAAQSRHPSVLARRRT